MQQDWLNQEILENPVRNIIAFGLILLAGLLLRRFVSNYLSGLIYRFFQKKAGGVDVLELRELLRKPFGLLITLLSIYIACTQIRYPGAWKFVADHEIGLRFVVWKGFLLSLMVSVTWILVRMGDFIGLVLSYRAEKTESKADDQLVPFIKESIKFITVTVMFFVTLGTVFKVNVASLIAGLGIGGLALALAAKDTLENLLGSFTIFMDKPFTLGDVVKVGNVFGKVEKIGFRSTQVRTFERTLITVPNKKMIDAELENISMRNMIRAQFPLTLRFETPLTEIENFRKSILEAVMAHPDIVRDPAPMIKLEKVTESGIELSFLFFVHTVNIDYFTTVKEDILLKLLDYAQKHDLRFDTKTPDLVISRKD